MNNHLLIGIAAGALLLVGAGCAKKETPPVTPAQPEAPASAVEENSPAGGEEPATAGEVRTDLRKDDTSASPKASAGAEAKPAQQQNQQSSPSQQQNQNTDADTDQQQQAPSVPTTKSFTITATQWAFSPNTITVKQGDTVRLRVTSLDVPHGFLVQGYNINKVVNPNETVMFDFVADKKGTFTFLCSVQCGAGHSDMRGRLVVE